MQKSNSGIFIAAERTPERIIGMRRDINISRGDIKYKQTVIKSPVTVAELNDIRRMDLIIIG